MLALIPILILCTLLAFLIHGYAKFGRQYALASQFPGPPALPLIGNALLFVGIEPDEFIRRCIGLIDVYGKTFRFWLGTELTVVMQDLRDIKVLLTSNKLVTKSDQYRYLKVWLHDGLLLSHGRKYQQRRKLITPAFHYSMLDGFLDCFQEHATVLVHQMRTNCAKGRPFELLHLLGLCMLDTICDTAMGVHTQAQHNADSEYVMALRSITKILHLRMFNIKYYFDLIFHFTPTAREAKRALAILDDFAKQVILQRRAELMHAHEEQRCTDEDEQTEQTTMGIKRKQALLDILLRSTIDGEPLDNMDIHEEVQTFIFAGHDTISSALMFFFYCIITNPRCEQKCYKEICNIFNTNTAARLKITRVRLQQLHYVEQCIKEALRMYPPVSFIGRKVLEECNINGRILPAGANIGFSPLALGRQPELYAEPNNYQPERFDVRMCGNATKPNSFAFTSFSAGPRNCLGSKYAMLQMKVVIVNILLNFKLSYVGDATQAPTLYSELTLRTKEPLMFTLRERGEKLDVTAVEE